MIWYIFFSFSTLRREWKEPPATPQPKAMNSTIWEFDTLKFEVLDGYPAGVCVERNLKYITGRFLHFALGRCLNFGHTSNMSSASHVLGCCLFFAFVFLRFGGYYLSGLFYFFLYILCTFLLVVPQIAESYRASYFQ